MSLFDLEKQPTASGLDLICHTTPYHTIPHHTTPHAIPGSGPGGQKICLNLFCTAQSCGVVWCGMVVCGVVWHVVWYGGMVVWHVVWYGVVWYGVVWCGVVWTLGQAVGFRPGSLWSERSERPIKSAGSLENSISHGQIGNTTSESLVLVCDCSEMR